FNVGPPAQKTLYRPLLAFLMRLLLLPFITIDQRVDFVLDKGAKVARGGKIDLRHTQARRVPVADIKCDQRTVIKAIVAGVINLLRRRKAVHNAKADTETIKHRLDHAAHGTLLRPHLDLLGLGLPEVAPVEEAPGAMVRVLPSADEFEPACLSTIQCHGMV